MNRAVRTHQVKRPSQLINKPASPRPEHFGQAGWVQDILARVVNHHAPFGGRRGHTEAKERHPRDVQHHMADIQRCQHQQRRDHRACQMIDKHPHMARTGKP